MYKVQSSKFKVVLNNSAFCILHSALFFAFCMLHSNAQTLQNYIDTALKNNPTLKSYQLESSGVHEKIRAAGAWDDPMLFGGIQNVPTSFSLNKDVMTMTQIGVQQNFSIAGKNSLKTDVAQREYEVSSHAVEARKLLLVRQIKQQYYDLYALNKSIRTTQSSIEVMNNYFANANARYGNGVGSQQDVLKAQLEITKMQEELIKMESERKDMTAVFNSYLNRSTTDSVVVQDEIAFKENKLNMASLMMFLDEGNEELNVAKSMIGKDSAEYCLMQKSKVPDFNFNLWYGLRQARDMDGNKAMDMVGFTLGITLPVYSGRKQSPLIAASGINLQKSQSQYQAIKNEASLMLHHALTDADKNAQLVEFYEKRLIPQAEQNQNSGYIGYQQDKIDFMTVMDNFLALYKYRLQYQQAIAEYMKAMAEIESLTGKILSEP